MVLIMRLKKRVYVGNSAGAMATTPAIDPKVSEFLYEESQDTNRMTKGLGLVNFSFFPHLNDEYFKNVTEDKVKEILQNSSLVEPNYLVDDNSALQVIDGKIKKIGEGIAAI